MSISNVLAQSRTRHCFEYSESYSALGALFGCFTINVYLSILLTPNFAARYWKFLQMFENSFSSEYLSLAWYTSMLTNNVVIPENSGKSFTKQGDITFFL